METTDSADFTDEALRQAPQSSQPIKDCFLLNALMAGDGPKNTVQRSYPERVMIGHRHTVMRRLFRLKDDMAAFLMNTGISEIARQNSGEITTEKIAWNLHQARTSSRTI